MRLAKNFYLEFVSVGKGIKTTLANSIKTYKLLFAIPRRQNASSLHPDTAQTDRK
jgi:hypothetical protein